MRAIYMDDSYVKEFEAEVISVKDDKFVTLSNTAFYPNGGGQPYDTGKLVLNDEEFPVVYVGKFGGNISHEISKPGLKTGDKVKGVINWDRRYKLMRSHTASHLLSAIMHEDYDVKITGNQLSEEKIRIDFSLENFDRQIIDEVIAKANKFSSDNLPVTFSYLPREKVVSDPALIKLAGAMPPDVVELRIVTIGDSNSPVDKQADGGTHVKNTSEIGRLVLLKADNKGKSNRRLYVELVD